MANILALDDNLELCKLIRTALERDGHRGFGQAADATAHRKAILSGHHYVQQDAVCPAAKRLGQRSARLPRFYPVAVPLQSGADQLAEL